jgi:hypothetical protein
MTLASGVSPEATQEMLAVSERAYLGYEFIAGQAVGFISPNIVMRKSFFQQVGTEVLNNKIFGLPSNLLAISKELQ